MMGASGIPLDYIARRKQPDGWTADNDHDRIKNQALCVDSSYKTDRMLVYGELKACCLDSEGWDWINRFDTRKYGRLEMVRLREHHEGAGEANKRVAWASDTIANSHYKSKHTFSFEEFSTTIHEAYTVLNENGETHSEEQMVRKMLEKMNVPNNAQMEA